MAKTDITAINAKTISVNGVPIAGSAAAFGPYTTFDQVDADTVLALNGTIIQGTRPPGTFFTNVDHLNVLSGVSVNETIRYGSASTTASGNATGPLNPGGGGFVPPVPIAVSISGTPPTTGTVGQPYSFTPVTSNGSGQRTYTLAGGSLLSGLMLSTSTGAITGTPTVDGIITGLSVRVTDATGSAATVPGNVTIAAIPVSISGVPPTTGVVGEQYSFVPVVSNGSGAKTFTLASGVLLGGLVFSTENGSISGAPNVAGAMNGIVVRVTDSTGSANTQATNVTIIAASDIPQDPIANPATPSQTFASTGNRTVDTGKAAHYVRFKPATANWSVFVGLNADGKTGVGWAGAGEITSVFQYRNTDGNPVTDFTKYSEELRGFPGPVVQVDFDPNKRLSVSANGIEFGFVDFSDNPAPFGNLIEIKDTGQMTDVEIGAFATPLSTGLFPPRIGADGRVEWDYIYVGSPTGFLQRVKNTDTDAVVSDWTATRLIVNEKGAGRSVGAYIAPRLDRLTYELAFRKSDGTPDLATIIQADLIRPAETLLGQGFQRIHYTNKLIGARINGRYGDVFAGNRESIYNDRPVQEVSERGDPIEKVSYYLEADEITGPVTWEIGCESGDLPTNITWGLTQNFRDFQIVDGNPRRQRFTFDCDRRINHAVILQINEMGATPPVGLYVIRVGQNLANRLDPDWIAEMLKIPGAGRHMDAMETNNPFLMHVLFGLATDQRYHNFDQDRARIHRIGKQLHGTPPEDLVLLHNTLNTAFWFNFNSTWGRDYFNSDGSPRPGTGREYGRKFYDLVMNGVGSDVPGLKLHSNKRHIIEPHNEAWNSSLGSWGHLVARNKDRVPDSAKNDNGRAVEERLWTYANMMEDFEAVVPNYATRVDRCLGLQMGAGDLFNLKNDAGWARASTHIDSYAKAPYLPGDPTAGFAPGQQPASLSPDDVVTWLRTYIRRNRVDIESDVQSGLREGKRTHIYEYNVAFPAIANRTKEAERAIKASAVFENFCRDEYLPSCIMNAGGQTCVYVNEGTPVNGNDQTWYAREGDEPWAGNGLWNAMKYRATHAV